MENKSIERTSNVMDILAEQLGDDRRTQIVAGAEMLADSIRLNLEALYSDHAETRARERENANIRRNTAYNLLSVGTYREITDAFRATELYNRPDGQLHSGMKINWNRVGPKQQHEYEMKVQQEKILHKAGRLLRLSSSNLSDLQRKKKMFIVEKPLQPRGILRNFKKPGFNKRMKEWEKIDNYLNKRIDSLVIRQAYLKNIVNNQKAVENLATPRLAKENPEVVKAFTIAKENDQKVRAQDRMENKVVAKESQDNDISR